MWNHQINSNSNHEVLESKSISNCIQKDEIQKRRDRRLKAIQYMTLLKLFSPNPPTCAAVNNVNHCTKRDHDNTHHEYDTDTDNDTQAVASLSISSKSSAVDDTSTSVMDHEVLQLQLVNDNNYYNHDNYTSTIKEEDTNTSIMSSTKSHNKSFANVKNMDNTSTDSRNSNYWRLFIMACTILITSLLWHHYHHLHHHHTHHTHSARTPIHNISNTNYISQSAVIMDEHTHFSSTIQNTSETILDALRLLQLELKMIQEQQTQQQQQLTQLQFNLNNHTDTSSSSSSHYGNDDAGAAMKNLDHPSSLVTNSTTTTTTTTYSNTSASTYLHDDRNNDNTNNLQTNPQYSDNNSRESTNNNGKNKKNLHFKIRSIFHRHHRQHNQRTIKHNLNNGSNIHKNPTIITTTTTIHSLDNIHKSTTTNHSNKNDSPAIWKSFLKLQILNTIVSAIFIMVLPNVSWIHRGLSILRSWWK